MTEPLPSTKALLNDVSIITEQDHRRSEDRVESD